MPSHRKHPTMSDVTEATPKKTPAKFSGAWYSPDQIAIALDGPLADPDRINLPIKKDAIDSYKTHGVLDPIHAVKGPPEGTTQYLLGGATYQVATHPAKDTPFAVDGRQRVRGAMLANQQLKAAKSDHLLQIKVLLDGPPAETSTLTEKLVIRNEHRTQDGPMAKARKAERLKAYGKSNVQIGATFGVDAATVAGWLALLNCIPEIQQGVEAGAIPARAASLMGKLPAAEQAAKLAEITAQGGTLAGKAGFENAANAARASRQPGKEGEETRVRAERIRSRELFQLYELTAPDPESKKFANEDAELLHAITGWMVGMDPTARQLKQWANMFDFVREVLKERKRRSEAV